VKSGRYYVLSFFSASQRHLQRRPRDLLPSAGAPEQVPFFIAAKRAVSQRHAAACELAILFSARAEYIAVHLWVRRIGRFSMDRNQFSFIIAAFLSYAIRHQVERQRSHSNRPTPILRSTLR